LLFVWLEGCQASKKLLFKQQADRCFAASILLSGVERVLIFQSLLMLSRSYLVRKFCADYYPTRILFPRQGWLT
jgi:hypothetical protein